MFTKGEQQRLCEWNEFHKSKVGFDYLKVTGDHDRKNSSMLVEVWIYNGKDRTVKMIRRLQKRKTISVEQIANLLRANNPSKNLIQTFKNH